MRRRKQFQKFQCRFPFNLDPFCCGKRFVSSFEEQKLLANETYLRTTLPGQLQVVANIIQGVNKVVLSVAKATHFRYTQEAPYSGLVDYRQGNMRSTYEALTRLSDRRGELGGMVAMGADFLLYQSTACMACRYHTGPNQHGSLERWHF